MVLLFIVSNLLFIDFISAATVAVEVDTGTETINALSGTLNLPAGVTVEEIYTGNSAVLIWIINPTVSGDGRAITFAGLSPGGFRGKHPVFTIEGPSLETLRSATFSSTEAYKNDGEGTKVGVRFSLVPKEISEDTEAPEPFLPVVASSPDLFEGNHFLSFAAQDKGTGVERYEFAATWFFRPSEESQWRLTQSPQLLSRIEKFQKLYVRAIDRQGNFVAVSTAGPYRYITLIIGLIIIVCVALFITRSLSLPSSPSSPQ